MATRTQGVSNGTQQGQGRLLPQGAVTKEQMVKASLEADDYLAVGALVEKTSVDALMGTTLKPPSSSGHVRSAWN